MKNSRRLYCLRVSGMNKKETTKQKHVFCYEQVKVKY